MQTPTKESQETPPIKSFNESEEQMEFQRPKLKIANLDALGLPPKVRSSVNSIKTVYKSSELESGEIKMQ
jgi:hypothetical protein